MHYSLSSSLARSSALNPDKLSLDLQFATDKSLTARKGPTPTFTRASAATYYGPLVDFSSVTAFTTTAISNGRASWFKSQGGEDITISYTGTQWKIFILSGETETEYFAAVGSEWRPDQANWSGSGVSVITSSTFGIVRSATNEPRFDHATTSPNASRGLLIEESRTNSITGSNAFNTWTLGNSTVTSSSVVTPEGTADAWKLVEDILLANHTATRPFTPVSGTTYTASVWLKSAENSFAFVGLSGGGFSTTFISVNLSTGAVSTAVGTPVGAASVAYSNGWWRVSFSLAATASLSSVIDIRLSRDGNWANRSYLGNGVNGMYCYGGQVEAGSFPTSYIPTTTASVVRSGDVCSITGSAFTGFYNQSEGTVLTDSIPAAVAGTVTVFSLSNGTANERWLNRFAQNEQVVITSAGTESTMDALNPVAGQRYKVVVTGKVNDFAMSINGLAAVTDTSQPMPVVDRAGIGNSTAVTSVGAMTIASIRYYKKRLSNAKIQALSTV